MNLTASSGCSLSVLCVLRYQIKSKSRICFGFSHLHRHRPCPAAHWAEGQNHWQCWVYCSIHFNKCLEEIPIQSFFFNAATICLGHGALSVWIIHIQNSRSTLGQTVLWWKYCTTSSKKQFLSLSTPHYTVMAHMRCFIKSARWPEIQALHTESSPRKTISSTQTKRVFKEVYDLFI